MIYQINLFSLARLNNQEVSALHNNVLQLLSTADLASLGLTQQQVTEYEQKAMKLTDQVFVSTASEHTPVMHEADNRRTIIGKRILLKLSVVNDAEEGSELQSLTAKVQQEILSKYNTKMLLLPMQEKTAVLKGFLLDLNEKLGDDDRSLLAIASDITKLEKANNDFQLAYHARSTERATAELQKTATLRNDLSDIFLRMCVVIQYNANMATEQAKREGATAFIKLVNVILSDALTRLRARKGLGGGGTSSGNGGSGSGSGGDEGGNGSGSSADSGNGSGTGTTGDGSGDGGGNTSGDNTSGGGSTSGNTGGNDHEIHDGVTEW